MLKGRTELLRLLCRDAENITKKQLQSVFEYLTFYGYITVDLVRHAAYAEAQEGIKAFQRSSGVPITGCIDTKTLRAVAVPRCGCPDKLDRENSQHVQFLKMAERTAAANDRWNKTGLKYHISDFIGGDISRAVQSQVIATAFRHWDEVCGLQISKAKTEKEADLIISAARGPQYGFDGKGSTLARAYMPQGCDQPLKMWFDLDETWVVQSKPVKRGVRLLNVASHEIGHLLGLGHAKNNAALMAPYYNPFVSTPQPDDIKRIQKLYGKNTTAAALTAAPTKTISLQPGEQVLISCSGRRKAR